MMHDQDTLLFLQLPIPRLKIMREEHNLPVAAYYLSAYLLEQPIAEQLHIQLLDPCIQNYGSDATILKNIASLAPKIICFSLFCWNVERSLYLAEQIKIKSVGQKPPLLLAGGPEVTPDNGLLHDSAIDLLIYGEGEYTLHAVLEAWRQDGNLPENFAGTIRLNNGQVQVNPPQEQAVDLNRTTSPYLKGLVPRAGGNEMFFETMRGCPFSCRFCYYNKQCRTTRHLAGETVLELFEYAVKHGYAEIFLLDPSFNIRPDLEPLLRAIARKNPERRIKIATELRADMIDGHLAHLLADAGIYEVELGLQSIHDDTMRQIGRTQHLEKFLRGARAMIEEGIETKVDLIVGLPGDNFEKFQQSARWVKRHGLEEYLQIFCLSLLPGTYFRIHAEEFGFNFSPLPPYYLISSPEWSGDDIKIAFSWAEDYFGITFEPEIDDTFSPEPMLDGTLREIIRVDPSRPFCVPDSTTSITKWLIGPIREANDLYIHLPAVQGYTRQNPYGAYQVYIELEQEIPLEALFDFYRAFTSLNRHFIDRDLSVLSLHETPLFHYRMEILIKAPSLPKFSKEYLQKLQEYFHLERIPS